MKKQIIWILTTMAIVFALFTGCAKISSPAEPIKPSEISQKNNIMGQYQELIKANSSSSQILAFIRTNIGNLSKNDAEIVIEGFISGLTKKLETYDYGLGFDVSLKEYKDLKDVQNFDASSPVKEEVKNKLLGAYSEGYKLHRLEDGYSLVVNYELIKTEFLNYISDKYADYISIMADTENGKDLTLLSIPEDLNLLTSEFIKILEKNNYIFTDEVFAYIRTLKE